MWFWLLYRLYLTRLGKFRHNRQLGKIEEPHVNPYQTLHFGEESKGIEVKVVPYLEDNYGYILIDETSDAVALVDPADPDTFDEYLETYNISKVDMILTTHKHWDHAAGNDKIREKFPDIKVYGGIEDRVNAWTHPVSDGDTIQFGNFTVEAIHTPCHTVGHTVFVIKNIGEDTIAFTGDFLFMGSWGMFFEGNATQMQMSFDKFLSVCPKDTKLLYGHEYALDNLLFAQFVDPENQAIQNKLDEIRPKVENKEICLPGTIKEELSFNPFLRADSKQIMKITEADDSLEALATLRRWKDDKKHKQDDNKKDK